MIFDFKMTVMDWERGSEIAYSGIVNGYSYPDAAQRLMENLSIEMGGKSICSLKIENPREYELHN